jgi:hypothetical protein
MKVRNADVLEFALHKEDIMALRGALVAFLTSRRSSEGSTKAFACMCVSMFTPEQVKEITAIHMNVPAEGLPDGAIMDTAKQLIAWRTLVDEMKEAAKSVH